MAHIKALVFQHFPLEEREKETNEWGKMWGSDRWKESSSQQQIKQGQITLNFWDKLGKKYFLGKITWIFFIHVISV